MIPKISIEELHKLGLLSVRAMNVCRRGGIKTLEQLINIDGKKLQDIKSCGKGTLMELNSFRSKFKLLNNEVLQKIDSPKQNPKLKEAQCKLDSLSPFSRAKFLAWIEWRFAKLSVRAKRAFPELSVCETAIDTIYSSENIVVPSAKHCGKKTIWEIELYLNDIKTHFEEITVELHVTDELPENKKRNLEIVQLSRSYSFLLNKECEAIIDFKCNNGSLPYLYIAKLFIARSHMPQIGIYRDYYGLNRSLKRLSLSEISEKYKLSRERVRQLLSKSISLPPKLKEEIKKYLEPLVGNVVAFDNSLWGKIREENMLDESYAATALLVCALIETHTAIQIVDCEKEYLVNESIVENVRVKQVLKNIVRIIKMRRTTIEQLDILQCITFEDKSYHNDVEELCVIFADYLKRNFSVEIDRNRIITLTPNTFDISATIENILEEKREPMTLNKIFEAFKRLYPNNEYDDPIKLKPYIFRNKNIKAKGNTGIYVLAHWQNQFTGTLTSYLEYILRSLDEPITLDDLTDFAVEQFPNTNKKSIYSLVLRDRKKFAIYEGEYVGLKDNIANGLNEHKSTRRRAFDSRFNDFKDFVITMKRMPLISSGNEEEQSLARWKQRVIKGWVEATDEQLLALQSFIDNNTCIPQNGFEYNFQQMCDQIKILVNKTFKLPDMRDNKSEYIWLQKNLGRYTFYDDNRKMYFEDLLAYLRNFGFILS